MNRVCSSPLAEELKAYLDGELSAGRSRAVARHLKSCGACREELKIMREMGDTLSTAGRAPLPESVRDRVLGSLTSDRAPALWRRKPKLALSIVGMGALSLLTFGVLYNQLGLSDRTIGGRLAQSEMSAAKSAGGAAANGPAPMQEAMKRSRMAPGAPATLAAAKDGESDNSIADTDAARADARKADGVPGGTAYYYRPQVATGGGKRLLFAKGVNPTPADHFRDSAKRRPQALAVDGPAMVAQEQLNEAQAGAPRAGEAAKNPSMPRIAPALDAGRKIYREASIGVAVSSPEQASARVEETVVGAGGYVASSELTTGDDGYKTATIDLRVPVGVFDQVMGALARMGEVTDRNVATQDLTDQVADSTSSEEALAVEIRDLEKKLARARTDNAEARREWQIRELRMRLAAERTRLGQLRKRTTYSQITVTLTDTRARQVQKPAETGLMSDLRDTNSAAAKAFSTAIRVPLVMLIWILAFCPIWLPLAIWWRTANKKASRGE